ncbi:hypothetical protein SCHPADRAFT_1002244 [Schizopora paradoxa]|uniref:Uncharacterized protein n=1 Tax=Schizopora paradoxa TaxID=27342 RepID=A0A0H2R5L5_9AGAM|nr:hypothetical protein SCHPADRAFT_1002244 [Schizopora paradoxa]
MSADAQLRKIVTKEETLEHAREILSLARVKTGPGSGRNLGPSAVGLPAVCAFLASERLGNNDVPEELAQKASCLAPRNFQSVVNTLRTALSDTLRRRSNTRRVTYEAICQENFIMNGDAVHWMNIVEKELEKTGKLEDEDVPLEAVRCAIVSFTCKLLGIKGGSLPQLIADYGLRAPDLRAVTKILSDDCTDVQMNIESFRRRNTNNGGRPGPSSPSKSTRAASGDNDSSIAQRLKRKASSTFTTPQPSPEKRTKTASPLKLNRVSVSPTKPFTRATSISQSPTKQTLGTVISTPRTPVKKLAEELPRPARTSPRVSHPPQDETPAKAALDKMSRLTLMERKTVTPKKPKVASSLPSPQKSPSKMMTPKKNAVAGPSTPSPTKKRVVKQKSPLPESDDEEEEAPRVASSRHRRPAFLDRQFYNYRDPRAVSENELSMEHFEELVKKFGLPDFLGR